jgi:GNAT superfamily N-acetyltransferase
MSDTISIVRLNSEELLVDWEKEYRKRNIMRGEDYFRDCWDKNINGQIITLLAYDGNQLAGGANLMYHSEYPLFSENKIPEINALDVFPEFQRRRIASRMFDEFEKIALQTSTRIGIGVGLHFCYGKAQRMYCKRGYIPDGKGMMYNNKEVSPGSTIMIDDCALYFIKELI